MSDELTILQRYRLSPKEQAKLSQLGYTTEDIKSQGLEQSRKIIKDRIPKDTSGDSKSLKINQNQEKLNKLLEKSSQLDEQWKKTVKIFNIDHDTNYTLDDFKLAKLIRKGGYGRGDRYEIGGHIYRFGPSDSINLGRYLGHNTRVSEFKTNNPNVKSDADDNSSPGKVNNSLSQQLNELGIRTKTQLNQNKLLTPIKFPTLSKEQQNNVNDIDNAMNGVP